MERLKTSPVQAQPKVHNTDVLSIRILLINRTTLQGNSDRTITSQNKISRTLGSDSRHGLCNCIIEVDDQYVTFKYQGRKTHVTKVKKIMGSKFIALFALHILPSVL